MYSEPGACKKIAEVIERAMPWLYCFQEVHDEKVGTTLTLSSDDSHLIEILGKDDHHIRIRVVVSVDMCFIKGERPPKITRQYRLHPNVRLVGTKENGKKWLAPEVMSKHIVMGQDDIASILMPNDIWFQSDDPVVVAKEYVDHIIKVEESLKVQILSNHLSGMFA